MTTIHTTHVNMTKNGKLATLHYTLQPINNQLLHNKHMTNYIILHIYTTITHYYTKHLLTITQHVYITHIDTY